MAGYWDGEIGAERVARLRELATQGLSCAEIANTISGEFQSFVSRNAVIGKLGRLKIANQGPKPRGAAKPRPAQKPKLVTVKPRPVFDLFVTPIEDVTDAPPLVDGVVSEGVNYLDNPSWGCKATIGKIGTDKLQMLCGQRRCVVERGLIEVDSAYCARHHQLFHQPREERRRRYG